MLHAGADAGCIGAALQDFFLLLFERSLLGQDFRELCVASFFIVGVNGFCQQALELLVELHQAAFNVSKAHVLTLHRQKLHGNCIPDKIEQCWFVAHCGVDRRQNCRLQLFFLDRRRIVAVFCAVIQAAGAAPDGIFSTEGGPCAAPVERPALATHEPVR